jgi:hypothetical protein
MNWLLAGGEIVAGVGLFVGLMTLVFLLRPPRGSLRERASPLPWRVDCGWTFADFRVWLFNSACRSRSRDPPIGYAPLERSSFGSRQQWHSEPSAVCSQGGATHVCRVGTDTINHERMPVLLTREEEFDAWLWNDPMDALALAKEYPPGKMRIVQEGFKKQDLLDAAA